MKRFATFFIIAQIGLFYGGENLEAKNMQISQIPDFFGQHGHVLLFIVEDVWKHLKYLLSFTYLH